MNQTAEFYFSRAEQRFQTGAIAGALSDLDQAIHLAPKNVEYRQLRAQLRHDAEQYDLAIEDYSVIIQSSTDNDILETHYRRRAFAYEILGMYDQLIDDLSWLISHGMGDANLYVWRGHHHVRSKRFQAAISDFSRARELSPDSAEIRLQLAQCRYQEGQYEAAISDLTDILLLEESAPNLLSAVYHWRGKSYAKLGNNQQALADFNDVLRLRGAKPIEDVSEYTDVHSDIP